MEQFIQSPLPPKPKDYDKSLQTVTEYDSISQYLDYFLSGYIHLIQIEQSINIPIDIKVILFLFYGLYIIKGVNNENIIEKHEKLIILF